MALLSLAAALGSCHGSPMAKQKRTQHVYSLVIQVGRAPDDGLPESATGAGLLAYATGVDEAEAVRETVALLKTAGMAPLDVTGYGTLDERLEQGQDVSDEERGLMDRALADNAVVIAEVTPIYEELSSDE